MLQNWIRAPERGDVEGSVSCDPELESYSQRGGPVFVRGDGVVCVARLGIGGLVVGSESNLTLYRDPTKPNHKWLVGSDR